MRRYSANVNNTDTKLCFAGRQCRGTERVVRWSKLKQRLERNFAESLRGRVALHQTRYRECHDQEGEFWITLDGVRILSIGSMTALNALSKARVDLQETGMSAAGAVSHAMDDLDRRRIFLLEQIVRQLTTWLIPVSQDPQVLETAAIWPFSGAAALP
jgi:hypothetical protein